MTTPRTWWISAGPGTDLWRKPPTTDVDNAAVTVLQPAIPQSSFGRARLTFAASYKYLYDQGGMVLRLSKAGEKDRWLKTGVELYQGRPYVSTVACDRYADWSIYPMEVDGKNLEVTIEVKKEHDKNGKSLMVYWVTEDKKLPLREIPWFFAEEETEWSISVGALAARPATKDESNGESLDVKFSGFEVDVL